MNDLKKFHYKVKRKKIRFKKKHKINEQNVVKKRKNIKKTWTRTFIAPSNFSLINNSFEVIHFFSKIDKEIKKCEAQIIKVFFDMSNVTEITVDSLIYLIAIIKNIKKETNKIYLFSGNIPNDEECSRIVKESGFLLQMESTNVQTIKNSSKLKICSGNSVDVNTLRSICDFIRDRVSIDIKCTKKLYTVIGEMMNNATQHAYSDYKDDYAQKWLFYIENNKSAFKFIFLDTGLSIPTTVNKKFLKDFNRADSSLVASALNGEMRSQTKLPYRGEGLQIIKKSVVEGYLNKLIIISNKACCKLFCGDNNILKEDFGIGLNGTLFCGEIDFSKEVQNYGN